jgi:hypothetical protein
VVRLVRVGGSGSVDDLACPSYLGFGGMYMPIGGLIELGEGGGRQARIRVFCEESLSDVHYPFRVVCFSMGLELE